MTSATGRADHLRAASEDRLLLAEATHRTAGEASSALAALHLIRAARGSRVRWRLLEQAIDRLEGFAAATRILSTTFSGEVDVGDALERLGNALASGRFVRNGGRLVLAFGEVWVDGPAARRVLLVAFELMTNAVRHALGERGGELRVQLWRDRDEVLLLVSDDGPGLAERSGTSGTGFGEGIVAELVRRCGGRLDCSTGGRGTTFQVRMPAVADPSADGPVHG